MLYLLSYRPGTFAGKNKLSLYGTRRPSTDAMLPGSELWRKSERQMKISWGMVRKYLRLTCILLLLAGLTACGLAILTRAGCSGNKREGEACNADCECPSGRCTFASGCLASVGSLKAGELCIVDDECMSGLCRFQGASQVCLPKP